MTLDELIPKFLAHGCKVLYAKPLAENDNSKNQIYFGPGFDAVNLFPNHGIQSDTERKNFKATLNFFWLDELGQLWNAPGAQLILYPQYPEVRFSGFLKSSKNAPSDRLNQRLSGRTLIIGVTGDGKTIGHVLLQEEFDSPIIAALAKEQLGVFYALDLLELSGQQDTKGQLINALRKIHEKGWIDSKQLYSDGSILPCNAPQCGGFTLEAELGVPKNSKSEPDYLGYEVKQHQVRNFSKPATGAAITLMTPEPKQGYYAMAGVVSFIRRFGYADMKGREDRLNFGGIHKVDEPHPRTKLTMKLVGFDTASGKINDIAGTVGLFTAEGELAAGWSFKELMEHWTQKHAKAVYVPSQCRDKPQRQYAYGHLVRIAEQTDFLRLLTAFAKGDVYYDPGIKLEGVSTEKPKEKRRSQFRIVSKNIGSLYKNLEVVSLSNG